MSADISAGDANYGDFRVHAQLQPGQQARSVSWADRLRPVSEVLRCRRCGDVIGVYEPLIRVTEGRLLESSRAVAPELSDDDAEHYHRACFERLGTVLDPLGEPDGPGRAP